MAEWPGTPELPQQSQPQPPRWPGEPAQQDQSAAQESTSMSGLAEQVGVGAYKSATGLAGLPGEIGRALQSSPQPEGLKQLSPAYPLSKLPGSADIERGIESFTGKPPEPHSTPEEYARTFGEFAPMVMGGEATLLGRVGRVLFPALTAETAKQGVKAFGGSETAQESAKLAGALTPGVLGFMWRTVPDRLEKATADLKAFAEKNYNHPDVTNMVIKVPSVQSAGMGILNDFHDAGFRELSAPRTADALSELISGKTTHAGVSMMATPKTMPPRTSVNYKDIASIRQNLNDVAGDFSNPTDQRWALKALERIDSYLGSIPQNELLAGNAQAAALRLADARKDYWAHKSLQLLGDKTYEAYLGAGSTYSGQNMENKMRQRLGSILKSAEARSHYTDKEIKMLEKAVVPGGAEQLMRRVSKMLPRHGAMGAITAFGAGTVGAAHGEPLLALAPAAIGETAAAFENKLANKVVRDLQEQIVSRSSAAEKQGFKLEAERHDLLTPGVLGRPREDETKRYDAQGNPVSTDETLGPRSMSDEQTDPVRPGAQYAMEDTRERFQGPGRGSSGSPYSGGGMRTLKEGAEKASQNYTKSLIPKPPSTLERFDRDVKGMNRAELIESEPLWGRARQLAEEKGTSFGAEFKSLFNRAMRNKGNPLTDDEMAEITMQAFKYHY